VAIFLISCPVAGYPQGSPLALALDLLALVVAFGFYMRPIAIFAAAVAASIVFTGSVSASMGMMAHPIDAVVLAMCGPGAFSIDARLFGRRTVEI
jgi:putative oxidoreductase